MSSSRAASSNKGAHSDSSRISDKNTAAHVHVRSNSSWNPFLCIERKLFQMYWNIEATYALSMLEKWEVFLVIFVFSTICFFLSYSVIYYFPKHIQLVARRAIYYVYGTPPSQISSLVLALNSSTVLAGSADVVQDAVAAVSSLGSSAIETLNETKSGLLEKLIHSSSFLWNSLYSHSSSSQPAEKVIQSNPELAEDLFNTLNSIKQMASATASAAAQKVDL